MCDRATVLRHGKVVGHCDPRQETAASLARMMVGNEVQAVVRAPIEGIEQATAAARGPRAQPQAGNAVLDAAQEHQSRRPGRRGDRHRRRRRQRPGRVLRGRFGRGAAGRARHRSASAARTPASSRITGRRMLGAAFVPEERLGHGAAPRMKLSENLLLSRHATDGKAFVGTGGTGEDRRHRRGHAADHRGDGRAQERARSGGGGAVGRQSAEIHRRPRTRPQPDRDGRQPADLGRRRGCGRQDPAGADRTGAAAARRCWSSARTSTNCSRSPTPIAVMHNGGLSEADADRRGDAARRSAC